MYLRKGGCHVTAGRFDGNRGRRDGRSKKRGGITAESEKETADFHDRLRTVVPDDSTGRGIVG